MSRTDKDVPYRIREYKDGHIDHDHRRGECRIETRQQALAPTWRRGYGHYSRCKKYEIVEEPCKGALLIHARVAERSRWSNRVSNYRKDTCTEALTELYFLYEEYRVGVLRSLGFGEKAASRFFTRYAYGKRYYCSRPHTVRVRRDDWPCACDNDPPDATCDYRLTRAAHRGYYYGNGSVPGWYVHATYHGPQRRLERDTLRAAMRDYNANGDTEIETENRQSRHEAGWSWW